jgi:hypothetical protein
MAYPRNVQFTDTHRLVPIQYSTPTWRDFTATELADVDELNRATDPRIASQQGRTLSISYGELVFGVPESDVINAAFCHPGVGGGRFNDSSRGVWYAGIDLETSQVEVGFHKQRLLEQTRFSEDSNFEYREFLADFAGAFAHLSANERRNCLRPGPVPECYAPGQALARQLLYEGSNGIVYASVRNPGGTCIACFRPSLVTHVRRARHCRLRITSKEVLWSSALTLHRRA